MIQIILVIQSKLNCKKKHDLYDALIVLSLSDFIVRYMQLNLILRHYNVRSDSFETVLSVNDERLDGDIIYQNVAIEITNATVPILCLKNSKHEVFLNNLAAVQEYV